ncbi:MAG: DUF4129 domain-containing protein, partial [Nocardioidaceae bacterium]
ALVPTCVALGVLVLVWAATTGPVGMLHGSGRRFVFKPPPPVTTPPSEGPTTGNLRETTRNVEQVADLSWVGDLIATTVLLAVCAAVFLGLRQLWLRRWQAPERPPELEFDALPDRLVEALSGDLVAQLEVVEQGDARNGIVACWLRLQEIVGDAGLPARASETSAEFVVRTLKALDLDPQAIGTLAALYREARFSEHDMGEDRRTTARTALQALHQDLRSRGTVR